MLSKDGVRLQNLHQEYARYLQKSREICSQCQPPISVDFACAERVEVRLFLDLRQHSPYPPTLEKVKAHDEQGRAAGNQKSWGNEQVDGLAKLAADGVDDEYSPNPRYMDAVQVLDAFRNTGSKMCLLL